MPAGGDVRIVQDGIAVSARSLANAKPVDVALVDGNGDQLTGFNPSRPSSAALTQVAQSAVSVTILAANAARRSYKVFNNTSKELRLAYAATASATAFTILVPPKTLHEAFIDDYTGVISGIWAAAGGGDAQVTEIS